MTDQTRYPSQRGSVSSQARSASREGRFTRRAEDPLAELARLIGQDDPFAEFNNNNAAPVPRRSQATPVGRHAPNGNGSIARPVHREEQYDDGYYEPESNGYGRSPAPARVPSPAPQYEDEEGYGYEQPARQLQPQRAPTPQTNGRVYSYGGTPVARTEPAKASRPAARQPQQPVYEDEYDEPQHYEAPRGNGHDAYQAQEQEDYYEQPPYEQQDYAPEYEANYAPEEYSDEYVEPVRNNRRWMVLGVMSLIGVVVLGITGIYGYRAIFKRHSVSNPPTIRSAETPSKVAPAAQPSTDGSKQNYDRIGEQPPLGGERVVSREEQPAIDANSGPRTVTTTPIGTPPGAVSAFAAPAQGAPALTPPTSTVNQANGEPRRVRTLSVRSDGSVVDGSRRAQPTAAPRSAPLALNPNVQTDPQDNPDDQPQVAQPPMRTASRPQAPANYAPAGSYVVQVSSQKTEQDAQTAWRQLQAKYTNVLGSAQVTFKRVDLGDRGTFYRAMVGPFANRDQAYEICQNLKAAGGECVVQRN
jgi:hypothetical protein